MKTNYSTPLVCVEELVNETILCASYADTEDYVGWSPWTELEV